MHVISGMFKYAELLVHPSTSANAFGLRRLELESAKASFLLVSTSAPMKRIVVD